MIPGVDFFPSKSADWEGFFVKVTFPGCFLAQQLSTAMTQNLMHSCDSAAKETNVVFVIFHLCLGDVIAGTDRVILGTDAVCYNQILEPAFLLDIFVVWKAHTIPDDA